MSTRALWYVAGTRKAPKATLYMRCNVKPGTNKNREGIAAVNEEAVEICVAAQAREGEANKAVVRVLSEVLDLPKSDLQITQGLKSRSKTVAAAGSWINSAEDECLRRAKEYLDRAIDSS
ncbi:YggU-like protein [Canariomyces notabilis]|uniref:YggU-like protein n=1 Tax=Canariomyces notabilis TaxID=2074819 RepID=A0AAN6YRE6_9PEZI|nr:YggU-like protein [Canariomyces arenarius]